MESKIDTPIGTSTHADAPAADGLAAENEGPVTRSTTDDLSVWQSARQHKYLGLVAMAAAFSASLDGYRTFLPPIILILLANMCIGPIADVGRFQRSTSTVA